MVILSWNLFHGRAVPSVNRSLYREFAAKLAGWEWDLALLQEVPPWWPGRLARELGAEQRRALTSRNALLRLRGAIAGPRPESLKSNGGGCNAILARVPVAEHSASTLRRWPERRVAQLARLGNGTWVANFHASTSPSRAAEELTRLWRLSLERAGTGPLILGGDLNLRAPAPPASEPGLAHVAGNGVDHLFARGWGRSPAGAGRGEALPGPGARAALTLDRETELSGRRISLSDHEPLLVELALSR
jgi:endonuclease/exonuclease/phosphatase family metal-dependent hydrolase